jgi:peptidyl-tRNA hydrolase ICT1
VWSEARRHSQDLRAIVSLVPDWTEKHDVRRLAMAMRFAILSRAIDAATRRAGVRWLCDEARACASSHEVPRHLVQVTHSRSSGSGGQNVNKVATKVTLRLPLVDAAAVLPIDLVERLRKQQHWRINKADELMVQCEEERTQGRNLKRAFARLQSMVDAAAVVPKERVVSLEPPERVKEQRRKTKRLNSAKKQGRRRSSFGDDH